MTRHDPRNISERFQNAMNNKPGEEREQRFYLCAPELAAQLAPAWTGQMESYFFSLAISMLNDKERTEYTQILQPDEGTTKMLRQVALGGREAEQRWPDLIFREQLRPVETKWLGIEEATWAELRWRSALAMDPQAFDGLKGNSSSEAATLEHQHISTWRSHFLAEAGDRHAEYPGHPSHIGASPAKRQKYNWNKEEPFSELTHLAAALRGGWPSQGERDWEEHGWLALATASGLRGSAVVKEMHHPEPGKTSWPVTTMEVLKQQLMQPIRSESGLLTWSRFGRLGEMHLGWAPLPELGEGITLIAVEEEYQKISAMLIKKEGK